ncbi:MAG: SGNH/GDSL hydrolase family protein [Nocardioidaceae bacterium]
MPARPALPLRLVAGLLGVTLLVGGCSSSAGSSGSARPARELDYVALGDSFTAGPLLAPYADSAGGCLRSAANYPSLLADELGATSFEDASCSGATTADVLRTQLRAVGPGTDLVTVGIGGNDGRLFGSLVSGTFVPGAPGELARFLRLARAVEGHVGRVLAAIHRRSPDARVLVVGYPQLLPDRGSCRAVPFPAAAYGPLNRVGAALNGSLRRAAESGGATYVDVATASRGHDICAGRRAWVNGSQSVFGQALAFHPFASGMAGVAAVIRRVLGAG